MPTQTTSFHVHGQPDSPIKTDRERSGIGQNCQVVMPSGLAGLMSPMEYDSGPEEINAYLFSPKIAAQTNTSGMILCATLTDASPNRPSKLSVRVMPKEHGPAFEYEFLITDNGLEAVKR